MDNMSIYSQLRECPPEALKTIKGGRLSGMSDINPMWRIKRLTELFGPQGIGWRLQNVTYWTETAPGGEIMAFCRLELVYVYDGKESTPVPGIGGSGLVNSEKSGLVANDEAFKMAFTDAISVATKGLGMAADVYWDKDTTKYSSRTKDPAPPPVVCRSCGKPIKPVKRKDKILQPGEVAQQLGSLCPDCWRAMQQQNSGQPEKEEA